MTAARPRWPWALAFVACLHVLTLPLTWMVTDKCEMIVMALRVLERGSFTLGDDGSRPVPEAPWIPRESGKPIRSRFLPGTSLVLAPFLALDKALGLAVPPHLGRVVHLQGFVLVLAALALQGSAARREGVGDAAIAVAICSLGTSFPVWLMSRNGGPEPVVALMLVFFLLSSSWRTRAVVLLLLPWAHATGAVLSAALALAQWLPGSSFERRAAWATSLAAACGCLSVVLVWNVLYHQDWLGGGYFRYGATGYFGANSLWAGLWVMAKFAALQLAVPALIVLAGALRARPELRLREPLLVLATLVLLFATTREPEPPRRLAVACLLFALPLARCWQSLRWSGAAGKLALLTSLAVGLYWLEFHAGGYYLGPGPVLLPGVVWVELALKHGWSARWIAPVGLLLVGLAVCWRRMAAAIEADDPSTATPRPAERGPAPAPGTRRAPA